MRRAALTHLGAFLAGILASLLFSLLRGDTDPNRAGGVTVLDATADDGHVLFAPSHNKNAVGGGGITYLIRKDGRVVNQWSTPTPPGGFVQLMPSGHLYFMGKSEAVLDREIDLADVGGSGVIYELDWNGSIRWVYEDPLIHHDFDVLPDGSVALLRWTPLPAHIAGRVKGGMPGTELKGRMWEDEIIEVTRAGDVKVAWRASGALDPARLPLPDYMNRNEWTHANSLRYVPSDPVSGKAAYLISLRQPSLVLLIERATGRTIWSYGGPGKLHQQHDPTVTDRGTILIFDNGQYLHDPPEGIAISASRVIEIDPRSNQIVWQYTGLGYKGWRFFSPIVSGAQRLPNGNTLITEGLPGRLFEVAPDGRMVWEYFHPYGKDDPDARHPNRFLFKVRSYPASSRGGRPN